MKRTVVLAAALAAMLAIADSANEALAQRQRPMPANLPVPAGMGGQGSMAEHVSMSERDGGGYYSNEFVAEDWSSGGCSDGSCGGFGCSEEGGCCDDCEYGCETGGSSWGDCCGIVGGRPRWFFTADYLYVRASFSEAVAYIEEVDNGIGELGNIVHELNFQHQSSYRLGGGYRLGCCDEEIRFNFTRLSSGANTVAPPGSLVPYEVIGPGTPTFIDADVDVKSFDLDFRKTIPLGGPQCCECSDDCSDPCGCGDACCLPPCPAWDITWSGGLRFADVDWNRYYVTFDTIDEVFRDADSSLDFKGGGPRVGLEGRRYFGTSGWCSIFLKGDISLLLGQMHQEIRRTGELGEITFLEAQGRRIIPVTEIEAGASTQLSRSAMLSAGYLFSAWHDLGFRDQFDIETEVESNSTDTANILGFDGLFVRLEVGY